MGMQWWGVRDRNLLSEEFVAQVDKIADAARDGHWDEFFTLTTPAEPRGFRGPEDDANATRVGGASGYAPLHQVAWHGAPVEIADRLIGLGAWRTLRCGVGCTPVDIAASRGHDHLVEALTPHPLIEVPQPHLAQLEHVLHAVIESRVHDFAPGIRLQMPQLGPLTERADPTLWFAVPGMYGGFSIELVESGPRAELDVSSFCRIAGGSGQRHRVRPDGYELVEEGFV